MTNFYDILGLEKTADAVAIKAAFRKLAKQYHPDKNPNGKEFFEKVLKAYETLSDPDLKTSYDYRLNLGVEKPHQAAPNPQSKTWKFDEKELKRRQYYNDHIRKYAKQTAAYNAEAETKKSYNEYKYILFATPLAVALFLLIMKLATPVTEKIVSKTKKVPENVITQIVLKPGDAPYNEVFGQPVYDTVANKTMIVKNASGAEALVCVFVNRKFVRNFFIHDNFSAEISQLPGGPYDVRYSSGLKYDSALPTGAGGIKGTFAEKLVYYKGKSPIITDSVPEVMLAPLGGSEFEPITPGEFFNY